MAGDEVRDDLLLRLARGGGGVAELLGEQAEIVDARLLHHLQHGRAGVLRGDLQAAARVVFGELGHVLRRELCQVHADARTHQHLANAGHFADVFHQSDQRAVVGAQELADGRVDARQPPALGLHLRPGAAHRVHVRGRPADVADNALEPRIGGELFDLGHHRFRRAALDDPALVRRDAAEGATAEAAAEDRHRVLDHLVRGDRLGVTRVRSAGVGQAVELVHLRFGQRQRRRCLHHRLPVVHLHQGDGIVRIRVVVDDPRRLGELPLVGGDGLEAGNELKCGIRSAEFGIVRSHELGRLAGAEGVGHAAEVAHLFDGLALFEALGDFDDVCFAHAVDEQVGLAIEQDGALHRIGPVIVMGEPAQGGFHPAGDHGHTAERLPAALGVDERRPVRAQPNSAAGGIGVVVADLLVRRVVVDERVHVPRADGEEQPRLAELAPRLAGLPVGLAENGDAESGGGQRPVQDSHGETGVIDVGVAGDEHHIHRVPTLRAHLRGRSGRKRSGVPLIPKFQGESLRFNFGGDGHSGQSSPRAKRCGLKIRL